MKHIRMIIRRGAPLLLCLCAICTMGVHCILPLAERPCLRYRCPMDKLRCTVVYADVRINTVPGPNLAGCFQLKLGSTETYPTRGWETNVKVYCDEEWRVKDIGALTFSGCAWLRLPQADNQDASEEYLSITMDSAAEAVYLAYDARADDVPSWLGPPDFVEETDAAGNPLYVTIPKPGQPSSQNEVQLRYYRHTQVPAAGTRFTFPGNLAGEPTWRAGFPVEESAMYIVLIQGKKSLDCTGAPTAGEVIYESCSDDCPELAQVETAAKAACQQLLTDTEYNVACDDPNCSTIQICADTGIVSQEFGVRIQPFAFSRSSEIEFNPSLFKSEALIDVAGQSFTRDVSGILHFEYLLDELGRMLELQINDVILNVPDLNTDIGTFSDTAIGSVAPFSANCDDASPPFVSPCNTYQIAQGDFVASVAADVADGKIITAAQNANPLSIQIDHVNRTFVLQGGPLTSTLEVNGEEQEVIISLDLTGHFLNFAPVASAIESDQGSDCEEGSNATAIQLNAAASFEIYADPLPVSQANYEWYENMGQATEKLWGTGQQIAIPPYQLSYGVHYFTLVLTDSDDVVDVDSFKVEVFDETPPILGVPQDIIVFQFPPETGAVSLAIGEAWAWDGCADQVMVSNDAPANLTFQPGLTPVTWEADDGRGNLTTEVQNVAVIPVEDSDSLLPAIGEGIVHVQSAVGKSQETISNCQDALTCPVDLGALVAPIDQLLEMAHDAADQNDEGADAYAALLESLGAARAHIVEASTVLEESNTVGEADAALVMREQAIETLMAAREALDVSAHQAELLEGDSEPTDEEEPAEGDEEVDEGVDEGTAPSGATRRTGSCGFGAGMILVCLPLLAIWKLRRRF